MRLTLRLQFHPSGHDEKTVLAQKTWADITSGNNPFWKEVHRSKPSVGHFGFPYFPHSNDEFRLHLGKSGYLVNFKAETHMGAETSIFGKVMWIAKADSPEKSLALDGDTIAKILEDEDWKLL